MSFLPALGLLLALLLTVPTFAALGFSASRLGFALQGAERLAR
jgi:hypothetical protein